MIAEFILTNHSRAQQLWILEQSNQSKNQAKIEELEKRIRESYKEIFGEELKKQ